MIDYYAQRASEYEKIYLKPERQNDLRHLETFVENACPNQDVLELACGTGYWTKYIAKKARSIVSTDYNEEVIKIARQGESFIPPISML